MEYIPDNYDLYEMHEREQERLSKNSNYITNEEVYEHMEDNYEYTLRINE